MEGELAVVGEVDGHKQVDGQVQKNRAKSWQTNGCIT
jgi:hypothetical protein